MTFSERIKSFFNKAPGLTDEFFEDLTDLLVEGDFGAAEAYKTADVLRACCKKEKISSPGDARVRLAALLETELRAGIAAAGSGEGAAFSLPAEKRLVVLLLGVNGVGKTTSAAKLAALCRDEYKRRPILAAADTFRAAAIDQIKIHGQRLGMRVVAHQHGGDPAAVVYDAIEAAHSGGGDTVIADTAGRMHTKSALVEELRKIDRVVESKAADALYLKYLVLDATTGRNALAQAEIFHEAVTIQGVIITKYDSTAKAGVIFSLASTLHLPVLYICTGEKYGDIHRFDARTFAREFAGLDPREAGPGGDIHA